MNNDKAFLQCNSNGTQIEQGLYLAHCCIYRIAGNLRELHNIAAFSEFLCMERESVWAATRKCYLRLEKRVGGNPRKFYLRNALLQPFPPVKVPKYSIDEAIVRVTTPIHHPHEPLGMKILARTLVVRFRFVF